PHGGTSSAGYPPERRNEFKSSATTRADTNNSCRQSATVVGSGGSGPRPAGRATAPEGPAPNFASRRDDPRHGRPAALAGTKRTRPQARGPVRPGSARPIPGRAASAPAPDER